MKRQIFALIGTAMLFSTSLALARQPQPKCSNYVMMPTDTDPVTPIRLQVSGNNIELITRIRSGKPYFIAVRLDAAPATIIGPVHELSGYGKLRINGISPGLHVLNVAFARSSPKAYSSLIHGGVLVRTCIKIPGNNKIDDWETIP